MGYMTRYKLIALTNTVKVSDEKIIQALAVINPREFDPRDVSLEDLFEEPCKWYDCEEDMTKLSAEFPQCTFILWAVGEEQGDVWKYYFKDGKHQRIKARLIFNDEPRADLFPEAANYEKFHPFDLCCWG